MSAQSSHRLPGKSYAAINQARLTPTNVVPHATPSSSQRVFVIRVIRVVWTKWSQTSLVSEKMEKRTTPSGARTRPASRRVARCQRSGQARRTREERPLRSKGSFSASGLIAIRIYGKRYLYPARSISLTASPCSSPALETLIKFCLNDPQAATRGSGGIFGLTGYSILESAKRFCAFSEESHSKN